MTYTFLVNAKAYATGVGEQGRILFQNLEEAQKAYPHVRILYAPQLAYLSYNLNSDLLLVAQHSDAISCGPHTGYILRESLQALQCYGSLINHSEHPLATSFWNEHIQHLHHLGLRSICCAQDMDEVTTFEALGATYIAYEPPELIGSDVSVSTAHPQQIKEAAGKVQKSTLLIGAGIHTKHDIEEAIRLGAQGVLIASSIMKNPTDKDHLYSLLDGFPRT